MKKDKLFIILTIILAAMFFITAAICNQCSITPSEQTKEDVADDTSLGTTSGETAAETTATTISEDPQAPEIVDLDVFMGPEYIEESGFCFYRVEAIVTGNPVPDIVFSKDDSDSAWGDNICQINLEDPSDNYTLTVTATNSEGEDEATHDFVWGCNGAEPEPEPEPEPIKVTTDISADVALSGMISIDWVAEQGENPVFVGDTPMDKPVKAYLSFDISDISALDDAIIKSVSVSIPIDMVVDHPELGGSEIHILVYEYGDSLELENQVTGGVKVMAIGTSASLTNLDFISDELADELQNAVDTDKEWFQLKISPTGINSNGIWDYYRIPTNSTVLHVKYEIPG